MSLHVAKRGFRGGSLASAAATAPFFHASLAAPSARTSTAGTSPSALRESAWAELAGLRKGTEMSRDTPRNLAGVPPRGSVLGGGARRGVRGGRRRLPIVLESRANEDDRRDHDDEGDHGVELVHELLERGVLVQELDAEPLPDVREGEAPRERTKERVD